MFFVSEEFLRQYESGDEITQTIDEAVQDGAGLFERGPTDQKRSTSSSASSSPRRSRPGRQLTRVILEM